MIPALGPEGHLPVGRYATTLAEIESRFVTDPAFSRSTTRADLWENFELYLATWAGAEDSLGVPGLLHRLWMAGSFASSELNPSDIDITVVVDQDLRESCKGKRGAGILRDLFGNRARVRDTFGVEPFVVFWKPLTTILDLGRLEPEERDYLLLRGAYEDLWERVRPEGPKGPLRTADARAARGFLEVIL